MNHRRRFIEAVGYNVINPFAQMTRFGQQGPGPNKRTKIIKNNEDIPSAWKGHITSEKPSDPAFNTPAKQAKKTPTISPADNKRKRDQPDPTRYNRLPTTNMGDVDMEASNKQVSTEVASRSAVGSSNSNSKKGNQETPIIRQPSHFGFPDVQTAVLTGTNYWSMVTNGPGSFATMQFRLTSLIDRQVTNLTTPAANASFATGNYTALIPSGNSPSWPATISSFPTVTTDGLQWRNLYSKMYGYYHIMGVEWELTLQNPTLATDAEAVIATYYDTYGPTQNTLVHPANAAIGQMEQWPDVTFTAVGSAADGTLDGCVRTIKGYYYPGKKSQNVENDEDVKTWTAIGASPDLTELVSFKMFNGWYNVGLTKMNCRMKMRVIVQYRDLVPAFRWPTTGQTAVTLTLPTDAFPN